MNRKIVAAMFLMAAAPAPTEGGAFGLSMGQPASSLPGAKRYEGGTSYTLTSVPKPNNEFESYMVKAPAQTGVCRVAGLGKTHVSDNYGVDTRAAFDRLHAVLTEKYGPAQDFDYLKSGSIWDEPRDWFMGLLKNERTKVSFWTRQQGARLPPSLESIALEVETVNTGPYLRLSYEFINIDRCLAVDAAKDNSGL